MPGSRTTTTAPTRGGIAVTVTVKTVKASCPDNQEALDRLQERLIKAQSNPNSNFIHTLRRGMVSLRECRHPITTHKEACDLKYVGPALAKIIVVSSAAAAGTKGSTTTTSPGGTKTKRKTAPKIVVAPLARPHPPLQRQPSSSTTATPGNNNDNNNQQQLPSVGPTSKEKAYHKAKQQAENLVLPLTGPWKLVLLIDGRERNSKQVVSQCKQSGIPCEERHLPIGDMAWIAQCVLPTSYSSSGLSSKGNKHNNNNSNNNAVLEIMVGTIIERKDVSDLAASLYGTRYSEQRLRLSQCGLPQVLFLVEGDTTQVASCPSETLQMAMMETRIQLGFQIVQTKNMSETVRVLKGLHRRIVQRTFPEAFDKDAGIAVPSFVNDPSEAGPQPTISTGRRRNRRPSSLLEMVFDTKPQPPFGATRFITYEELKAKVLMDREQGTKSVQAVTMAMLKQIPSLSHKKCTAVAEQYPTMNRLIEALCYHQGDQEALISAIPMGRQTIGPKSASQVVVACCTLGDGSVVASHIPAAKPPSTKKAKRSNTAVSAAPARKPPPANSAGTGVAPARAYDSDDSFSVAPIGSFASNKPATGVNSDHTTPALKRKATVDNPLSDFSGWSSSTATPGAGTDIAKRSKTVKSSKPTKSNIPVRAQLSDSFLLSSPDETLTRPTTQTAKPPAQAKVAPKPKGNVNSLIIACLDSDSDDSPMATKSGRQKSIDRYEQNLRQAIQSSELDTPSTASSSFSTPGVPHASVGKAARKVSNGSSSSGKSVSSIVEATARADRMEVAVAGLRERLARRMEKEIIEIDL